MWLVLLFVSFLNTALASESVGTIIEQAQTLALKKNRKEACALLNRTYANLGSDTRGRTKLVETLGQISKVFFTDKGQKLFESGQVNMFDNPDLALKQLREAQNLEDENIRVLAHLSRVQILKKDCDGALISLEMARSLNPHAAEPAILELRAILCAKRFELFRDKLKTLPNIDKWDAAFGQYLLGQELMRTNSTHKAFDIFTKVTEDFPQFPEAHFYLAQAGAALEKDSSAWLQKYSVLCKGLTLRERKRFSYEPLLCGHLKEAEDELLAKKNEN